MMKYRWNGNSAGEAPAAGARYSLVMYPIAQVDGALRDKISRAADISLMDVKLKVRSGGYLLLRAGDDERWLRRAAEKLAEAGVAARVFSPGEAYDVPEAVTVKSGEIREDVIRFIDGAGAVLEMPRGGRLMLVRGRISGVEANVSGGNVKNAMNGIFLPHRIDFAAATGMLRLNKSVTGNTFGVLDIYCLDQGGGARVVEGRFNFREFFGGAVEYSFLANERTLVDSLRRHGEVVAEDCSFEESSLPLGGGGTLPDRSLSPDKMGSMVVKKINDFGRFENYSRFRYIVEKYPPDPPVPPSGT